MPFKDKSKRNEYQRNYKRKQAEELKRLRQLALGEKKEMVRIKRNCISL